MQETTYTDYLGLYRRGPYASYLKEQRLAGSAPVRLLVAAQPAGRYSAPPMEDFHISVALCSSGWYEGDWGVERWKGKVEVGTLAIARPGLAANFVQDAPFEFANISLPSSRLYQVMEEATPGLVDFGLLHAAPFRDSCIEAICHRMWAEAGDHRLGSLFCESAVMALAAALLSKAEVASAPLPVRRGGLAPYRIRRVQDLIRDRLAEDIGLDELSAAAGLSSSHFARAFRAETGETPWRYLLARRVEHAQHLLAGTSLSLPEVARACGFADQSHLGTWFKRLTGATPRKYREDRRQ